MLFQVCDGVTSETKGSSTFIVSGRDVAGEVGSTLFQTLDWPLHSNATHCEIA